jgi:predicted SprT family Zn-dependent metalloprotease
MMFDKLDIELIAEHLLEVFLHQYFPKLQAKPQSIIIEVSPRMTAKIGLALLFENRIKLSEAYFCRSPHYLPYTVFHELTHLWLYHQGFDPGHTSKFYEKMKEFTQTGYLVDPEVHIHTRLAPESKYVYTCENCSNRWHLRDQLDYEIFCGHCWRVEKNRYYATLSHVYDQGTIESAVGGSHREEQAMTAEQGISFERE